MVLRLEDKKSIVEKITAIAGESNSVVAAQYAGLTVAQLTELRHSARKAGIKIHVVRNTLAKRAFQGTQFSCMDSVLTGPLLLAFSNDEIGDIARLFKDFVKKFDKLQVRALSCDGALLAATDLTVLAGLPTRQEAIAKLLGMLNAPITTFVRTLAEPHAKLVRTLAAIRDKKQNEEAA